MSINKYRLIKEYPGSPKLGTMGEVINKIVMYTETDNDMPYYSTNYIDFKKHPEYWEEIVEKDYEILSIYNKISDRILTDSNVQTWIIRPFTRQNWEIHSIKRLSDGEVFTVGDNINQGVIENIIIKEDKIYLEI